MPSVPGFLAWRRGDPRRLVLTVVDTEGDPVDLSASTWTAQVRASRSSATATTLATDSTEAAAGVLTFTLTGEQTRALTAHTVYGDVEGSAHGTLLEFKANVSNDVTRVLDGDDTVEPTGGLADVLTVSLTQDTVQLVAQSVAAISLLAGSGAEDVEFTPAGGLVATDVQAALVELDTEKASVSALDAETSSRAAADTALDGRLATVEGDYLQSADIADMETEGGAQAKADAAQAAAVQRANHTGVQPSTTISDFTEAVQDAVAALLGAGSNVVLTYDDGSDTLTIDSVGDGTGLDAEAVRDAIGVALVGAGLISVAVNDAFDTITISTSASANSTDDALRDRTTHTGEQAIATVTGLQAALDAKAPVASPALTGTPTAPTAAAGTNTTQIATTAHVKTAVDNATSGSTAAWRQMLWPVLPKAQSGFGAVQTASTTPFNARIDATAMAQNDYITWNVSLSAGTWSFELMFLAIASGGIATLSLDGTSVGTFDNYASTTTNGATTRITGVTVATSGDHEIKLSMATKNASSTGYRCYMTYLACQRTA